MENKVYYGEYSLRHWIDLILKKNLVLPKYQRFFVWKEKDVKKLMETFKNKLFVPPVTIGAYKTDTENQNLILDGQQRLTSILLAYLGLYPDEAEYKIMIEKFADENDDASEINEQLDNILEWKFSFLTEKGNNKQDILTKIPERNYKKIDFNIEDKFLETTYLGFSYLVPHISDNQQQKQKQKQQKYYSSVFRNINNEGTPLKDQESREALYFLDDELELFFKPEFCNSYVVKNLGGKNKMDFVKYLSLLSQFYEDQNENNIARGYKPIMETYYEDYINSVIEDSETKYGKFTEIFPNKKYDDRINNLQQALNTLDVPKEFTSIIDMDLYFFGLIYTVVFENETIDFARKDELIKEIEDKISMLKEDPSHKKTPSNLGHLRYRIISSIEIYEEYAS